MDRDPYHIIQVGNRNTPDGRLLDKNGPAYIGGILEMANARLYGFWGDLTEALQTGSST